MEAGAGAWSRSRTEAVAGKIKFSLLDLNVAARPLAWDSSKVVTLMPL
jgi:hypothetical protein